MLTKIIEFRMCYDHRDHRFWIKHYWKGTITSGVADERLMTAFLGEFAGFDGWFSLWAEVNTITTFIRSVQVQVISPYRSQVRDESVYFKLASGHIITGTQAWHATCRVNFFSRLPNHRPHWWQISPVPEFSSVIGISRDDYLQRVVELAQLHIDGFGTDDGDQWRGVVRSSDGDFGELLGFDVNLFSGRQKTRRRVS